MLESAYLLEHDIRAEEMLQLSQALYITSLEYTWMRIQKIMLYLNGSF